MGIPLSTNFNLTAGIPLDSRVVVSDITQRDNLVTNSISYVGMIVFVTSTNRHYYLNTNNIWDDIGGGDFVYTTGNQKISGSKSFQKNLYFTGGSQFLYFGESSGTADYGTIMYVRSGSDPFSTFTIMRGGTSPAHSYGIVFEGGDKNTKKGYLTSGTSTLSTGYQYATLDWVNRQLFKNWNFDDRPTVNGIGVLLQGEATAGGSIANIVYTTGNQNINGEKTFNYINTIITGIDFNGEVFARENIEALRFVSVQNPNSYIYWNGLRWDLYSDTEYYVVYYNNNFSLQGPWISVDDPAIQEEYVYPILTSTDSYFKTKDFNIELKNKNLIFKDSFISGAKFLSRPTFNQIPVALSGEGLSIRSSKINETLWALNTFDTSKLGSWDGNEPNTWQFYDLSYSGNNSLFPFFPYTYFGGIQEYRGYTCQQLPQYPFLSNGCSNNIYYSIGKYHNITIKTGLTFAVDGFVFHDNKVTGVTLPTNQVLYSDQSSGYRKYKADQPGATRASGGDQLEGLSINFNILKLNNTIGLSKWVVSGQGSYWNTIGVTSLTSGLNPWDVSWPSGLSIGVTSITGSKTWSLRLTNDNLWDGGDFSSDSIVTDTANTGNNPILAFANYFTLSSGQFDGRSATLLGSEGVSPNPSRSDHTHPITLSFPSRPTVNGTGVLLSGEAAQVDLSSTVRTTGNQTISGIKKFTQLNFQPVDPSYSSAHIKSTMWDGMTEGIGLFSLNDQIVNFNDGEIELYKTTRFSQRPTLNGTGFLLIGEATAGGDLLFNGNRQIKRDGQFKGINPGGTTISGFLNNLFYPFVQGSISLNSIALQEKGKPLASVPFIGTITSNDDTITNLKYKIGGSQVGSTVTNPVSNFSYSHSQPITATTTISIDVTSANNGNSNTLSASQTIDFEAPYYWGVGIAGFTEADIKANLTKVLQSKSNKSHSFTTSNEKKYIVISSSWGAIISILDPALFENIGGWTSRSATFTLFDSTPHSYTIWEANNLTTNTLTYTFKF